MPITSTLTFDEFLEAAAEHLEPHHLQYLIYLVRVDIDATKNRITQVLEAGEVSQAQNLVAHLRRHEHTLSVLNRIERFSGPAIKVPHFDLP